LAHGSPSMSRGRISHLGRAERCCIIRLVMQHLFDFLPSAGEGGTSRRLVATEPSGKTLARTVGKWNVFVVTPAPVSRHCGQRTLRSGRIALAQGYGEPMVN